MAIHNIIYMPDFVVSPARSPKQTTSLQVASSVNHTTLNLTLSLQASNMWSLICISSFCFPVNYHTNDNKQYYRSRPWYHGVTALVSISIELSLLAVCWDGVGCMREDLQFRRLGGRGNLHVLTWPCSQSSYQTRSWRTTHADGAAIGDDDTVLWMEVDFPVIS